MDVLSEILINANNPDILYTIHSRLPLDFYIPLIDHRFSRLWIFIGNTTYRNGEYHSFNDKPAVILPDGTQYWFQNDKCHRDNDKPAVIHADGTQEWYKYNKLHRDNDKPAVILPDGDQYWYKYDKRYYPNI